MRKRIAIICDGGVLHGAYIVGLIKGLKDIYGIKEVDYIYTISSSAGTMAYYVSGQFDQGIKIWTDYIPKRKFLALRPRPMNLDYLIDDVFRKKIPLNLKKIRKSKTKFFIAATKTKNGQGKLFLVNKNKHILNIIKASMALPLLSKTVKINNEKYADGYFSHPMPYSDEIKKADIVIVIAAENLERYLEEEIKIPSLIKLYSSLFLGKLKDGPFKKPARIKEILKKLKNLEKQGKKIILLYPKKRLPYSDYNNSKKAMERLIKIGFNQSKNNKNLKETFLNKRI